MSPQTAEYNSFTKCDSKSAECIQCVLVTTAGCWCYYTTRFALVLTKYWCHVIKFAKDFLYGTKD